MVVIYVHIKINNIKAAAAKNTIIILLLILITDVIIYISLAITCHLTIHPRCWIVNFCLCGTDNEVNQEVKATVNCVKYTMPPKFQTLELSG